MPRRNKIQVNDLDRYQKSSDRLVLEEYSSCEVPAGCGGAILRWIDPRQALPLHLWLYTSGKAALFFDGTPIRASLVDAGPGKHVLAIGIRPEKDSQAVLAFSLRYADTDTSYSEPTRSRSIGRKVEVLSGETTELLGTASKPESNQWQLIDFDDRHWSPLTRKAATMPRPEQDWHLKQVEEAGGHLVALPKAKGPIWVRCTFHVDLGGGT